MMFREERGWIFGRNKDGFSEGTRMDFRGEIESEIDIVII